MLTLFYFSVWELGIAGAEASLAAILSPAMLGVKSFRNWASTRIGRVSIHILGLAGLIAYKFPSPAQRLLLVTFAAYVVCIGAVVDWSNPSTVTYSSIREGSCSHFTKHSQTRLCPQS